MLEQFNEKYVTNYNTYINYWKVFANRSILSRITFINKRKIYETQITQFFRG
ncbi:hypothetical protein M2419_002544 [Sphingobacterium sp. BIGb0116]|nr:hypothetical protein [Sphingobacterium sp. BIGb0116]